MNLAISAPFRIRAPCRPAIVVRFCPANCNYRLDFVSVFHFFRRCDELCSGRNSHRMLRCCRVKLKNTRQIRRRQHSLAELKLISNHVVAEHWQQERGENVRSPCVERSTQYPRGESKYQ